MNCINCGEPFRSHVAVGDVGPEPVDGNLSICLRCGLLQAFTDDGSGLATRRLTEQEEWDLRHDVNAVLMLQETRATIERMIAVAGRAN